MNGAQTSIRRLRPTDVALYRHIRLEALRLAPEAFASTLASENGEPLTWFAARLDNTAVFAAFAADELLGIAGFLGKQGPKDAHKGVLWGMYVRPNARAAGIGKGLGQAVIEYARRQVEILQLSVVATNEPARRLYAKLGFVEYGIEKNALRQDGRYWDEVLMAKSLMSDETARA